MARRKSSTLFVQELWGAIDSLNAVGKAATTEQLWQVMASNSNHPKKSINQNSFETQLPLASCDGLLTISQQKGCNSYSIPDDVDRDGHDWYCYKCHSAGEVFLCSRCWRVYHPECLTKTVMGQAFVCPACKSLMKKDGCTSRPVNHLLAGTMVRMRDKTDALYNLIDRTEAQKRQQLFVCHPMDLDMIQDKILKQEYNNLIEFRQDIQTIVHNVRVCFGVSSDMAKLADILVKDCRLELVRLLECEDCYFLSNNRIDNWFCYPCTPQHQLVYAKVRGYTYWPAKVIKITEEGYDVRFFGTQHQRGIVTPSNIRTLDEDRRTVLGTKRTTGLDQACRELDKHLKMLEEGVTFNQPFNPSDLLGGMKRKEKPGQEKPQQVKPRQEKLRRKKSVKVVRSSPSSRKSDYEESPEHSLQSSDCLDHSLQAVVGPSSDSSAGTNDLEENFSKILNEFPQNIHDIGQDKTFLHMVKHWCMNLHLDQDSPVISSITNFKNKLDEERMRSVAERKRLEDEVRKLKEEKKKMQEDFSQRLSDTKKQQWCFNCESEAQYYCCWNTAYCSHDCQRQHWHSAHKQVCRRRNRHNTSTMAMNNANDVKQLALDIIQ